MTTRTKSAAWASILGVALGASFLAGQPPTPVEEATPVREPVGPLVPAPSFPRTDKVTVTPRKETKPATLETRMFSLAYTNVSDVASVLESLFNEPGRPRAIRIGVAKALNTVVVQGSPQGMAEVADMVQRLEDLGAKMEKRKLNAAPVAY